MANHKLSFLTQLPSRKAAIFNHSLILLTMKSKKTAKQYADEYKKASAPAKRQSIVAKAYRLLSPEEYDLFQALIK